MKGEQRVELVGGGTVLARRERQHGCSEASLGSVGASWKARVGLPESASRVAVSSLINRQVGKKDKRCTCEAVLGVATEKLP